MVTLKIGREGGGIGSIDAGVSVISDSSDGFSGVSHSIFGEVFEVFVDSFALLVCFSIFPLVESGFVCS